MTRRQSDNAAVAALALCIILAILSILADPAPAPALIAPPMPTPQVVKVEVPGPPVEVPVYVTPEACFEALDINAEAWTLNQKFMAYLMDEGTWDDDDQAAFTRIVDAYVLARDECAASYRPAGASS